MAPKDDKVWERRPSEPSKWYDRFLFYLEQGPERTLETAHSMWWDATNEIVNRKRGKPRRPPITWYEAAREWKWKDRALAWDDNIRSARLKKAAEGQADLNERQVKTAMAMQQLALRTIRELAEPDENGKPKKKLTPREAMAYVALGIKLERQARGLPTETLEYYALTDEELMAKYAELYRRLEAVGGLGGGGEAEGPGGADAQPGDFGDAEVPTDL